METALHTNHSEDQIIFWNEEHTYSFDYVVTPFGHFVKVDASSYSTEFTLVEELGKSFGSSVTVYHPEDGYGDTVRPAYINGSTSSNATPQQARSWAWMINLAADYAEAVNDNHLDYFQALLDEENAKWKLEAAVAKAAKEALVQERLTELDKIDWTTARFRIRKAGNWRSGSLRWNDPSQSTNLILTETGGSETKFHITSDLMSTLQVKNGSRYSNVF